MLAVVIIYKVGVAKVIHTYIHGHMEEYMKLKKDQCYFNYFYITRLVIIE